MLNTWKLKHVPGGRDIHISLLKWKYALKISPPVSVAGSNSHCEFLICEHIKETCYPNVIADFPGDSQHENSNKDAAPPRFPSSLQVLRIIGVPADPPRGPLLNKLSIFLMGETRGRIKKPIFSRKKEMRCSFNYSGPFDEGCWEWSFVCWLGDK